jgi:SAM-dependent methyltransferase
MAAPSSSYAMPSGSSDGWADDYERGRPGWPQGVVDLPGLDESGGVVEIGAGTGKLTQLLQKTFSTVIAVEPADAMRRLLRQSCPTALLLSATAEEIPLTDSSVDCIFVAEAFHKFDGERAVGEFARVLPTGGYLVLIWNVPAEPTEPSTAEAERFLTERAPDRRLLGVDPTDLATTRFVSGEWRAPFEASPFEDLQEIQLPNPQTVDRHGLISFYASMGWIGDLADAERLPLLDELGALLPAEEYRRHWTTRLYWTRRVR